MSALSPSGYGRMDVATFAAQLPRPNGGVATAVVNGMPQPVENVGPAGTGNPSFPWAGLVLALVLLRVATHLRKE